MREGKKILIRRRIRMTFLQGTIKPERPGEASCSRRSPRQSRRRRLPGWHSNIFILGEKVRPT